MTTSSITNGYTFPFDTATITGDETFDRLPCTDGHVHAFEVAKRTDHGFIRATLGSSSKDRVAESKRRWNVEPEQGYDATDRDRYMICAHCKTVARAFSSDRLTGAPHRKSYRPDLPFSSTDAAVAKWADGLVKRAEAKAAESKAPAPIIQKNKPHPKSYGADLPLHGHSEAGLLRVTADDKKRWADRPVTTITKEQGARKLWHDDGCKSRATCECRDARVEIEADLRARGFEGEIHWNIPKTTEAA